jgi:hypothetical protein
LNCSPANPHNPSYLTRYIQTGEARILNTTRYVLGLTKMHSVFPISLTVAKISGAREEAIFMGVIRPSRNEGDGRVRVWVAPGSGLVLTADEAYADLFGFEAAELVGRCVSTLGPDIESLDRCAGMSGGGLPASLHPAGFGGRVRSSLGLAVVLLTTGKSTCRMVADASACSSNEKIKCCTQLLHRWAHAWPVHVRGGLELPPPPPPPLLLLLLLSLNARIQTPLTPKSTQPHRFLPPNDVEIEIDQGGTNAERPQGGPRRARFGDSEAPRQTHSWR